MIVIPLIKNFKNSKCLSKQFKKCNFMLQVQIQRKLREFQVGALNNNKCFCFVNMASSSTSVNSLLSVPRTYHTLFWIRDKFLGSASGLLHESYFYDQFLYHNFKTVKAKWHAEKDSKCGFNGTHWTSFFLSCGDKHSLSGVIVKKCFTLSSWHYLETKFKSKW